MNSVELNALFDRLGTPLAGRRLVEKARKEAPVRDIQSHSSNVITWYSSRKMGRAIGTESRTVEFPAAIQYEHDHLVLEYYPQPCQLDLIITAHGKTRPSRVQHTPDFLIIRSDQIFIEEWREEGRLEKLAEKYPGRFIKEVDCWRYPASEEHLGEMGITYRLRSANEHPRQYVSNLIFLSDYLSPSCLPVEQKKIDLLHSILAEKGELTIAELLISSECENSAQVDITREAIAGADSLVTADDIYKAIADGHIAFDLMNDDIAETHRAAVYRDKTMLAFCQRIKSSADINKPCRLDVSFEAGTEVDYDGKTYRIALVGQKSAILSSDNGTTELSLEVLEKQYADGRLMVRSVSPRTPSDEALSSIAPQYLDKALERVRQIEYSEAAPELVVVSKRTLQRCRKAVREAGNSIINQHMALIPKQMQKGNRERKIPKALLDTIEGIVEKDFNNPTNITKGMAYKKLVDACQSAGLNPCSTKTFNKEVDRLASIRERKGKRVLYQSQPIVWYLKLTEPIHGVRPFQYVHIDHTPLEILLCSPNLKKSIWRAWLSLAIDAESRKVVGFYLSFEPPSYRSCMMVLRDIVRRHGRMPDMIVVDNGKEFKSLAFKRVCELYGCSIRYRPAGQPRHGSVMERLFGTTQSQLIHNLSGNTQLMRQVRTVTKSVNPRNFVEWTLPALHGALDFYFDNLYGTEIHPAPEGDGTRSVDVQRGVKINHIWYWSNAFRDAGLNKKHIDIRIDPWDVRFVYALIKGEWQQCESKLALRLRQYTVIELRYAFEELSRENNIKKKDLSPERIAEWIKVLDAKNFDNRLKEQQKEARILYERLGMTTVGAPQAHIASTCVPVIPPSALTIDNTSCPPLDKSMIAIEEEEYELF